MKVNFKKIAKYMLFFEIIYTLFINGFCDFFNLPKIIKFLPDISTIFLGIYLLVNIKKIFANKKISKLFLIIALFTLSTLISFFINKQPLILYIWGLRKVLRFFILFFSAYLIFDKGDVYRLNKVIYITFIINLLLIICQYLVFGLRRDYIGGTFAFSNIGGNVSLIPFLALNTFIFISKYQNKELSITRLLLYLIPIITISAIAELKIMFVIIFISLLVILFVNKREFTRNLGLLIILSVLVLLSLNLMFNIYPEWRNKFDISHITEIFMGNDDYGYSTAYDLSRGRAVAQINDRVFKNDHVKYLFGYGTGNCDYSSIKSLTSDFYSAYGRTLHHTWFVHSLYYLENGGIGLALYVLFFTVNIYYSYRILRNNKDKGSNPYLYSALLCSIISLLLIIYNEFLKIDTSFFWYSFLCIPYIIEKGSIKDEQ